MASKYHRKRFPPRVYADIINRQNNRCGCGCREKFDDVTKIEFDHHLPLILGGEDHPDNLRAVKKTHHLAITRRQATAVAKMKRLQKRGGGRKLNQRDKAISRMTGIGS